jgi:NAD(P)-dependent dehydrogenase (short-subunit alcohol dehydrogenase family)
LGCPYTYKDFTMTTHPALTVGRMAVITGAASGIGLATAKRLASLGMRVCLVDIDEAALEVAKAELSAVSRNGALDDLTVSADVSDPVAVAKLRDQVLDTAGDVAVVMCNAGMEPASKALESGGNWRRIIDVNLWGVIHCAQAFAPAMLAQGLPGAIIATGSKQGITCPPGNAAYNLSKAGVKVFAEQLAHELRNSASGQVTAHLLIPGFTYTGFTRVNYDTKPPGAWMPEQVADRLIAGMGRGDFYILCPDNDVSREMDEKRIQWAADDIIKNRPALSRWHPDFEAEFASFMAQLHRS